MVTEASPAASGAARIKLARRNAVTAAAMVLAVAAVASYRALARPHPRAKESPVSAEPTPASPSPSPPPIVSSRPAAARAAPSDEASLMARLRAIKDADPASAIDLAREGNARFPDSADAPERASILVHALAKQGRAGEARGEAESMVNHYPDSSWVREIERFTGAHRHRSVRLRSDGTLEYY